MSTHHSNICLVAQAADCVPILFYDPVRRVIAAAHAGWRGTAAKIAAAVVGSFREHYDSDPRDILVGIGPSIGPCCYEVGLEVAQQVMTAFPDSLQAVLRPSSASGKYIFNLWEANCQTLLSAGVSPQNMEVAEICTRCNNQQFFSARAGDHGRFGAFIMLR
jgi:YfiH family protein